MENLTYWRNIFPILCFWNEQNFSPFFLSLFSFDENLLMLKQWETLQFIEMMETRRLNYSINKRRKGEKGRIETIIVTNMLSFSRKFRWKSHPTPSQAIQNLWKSRTRRQASKSFLFITSHSTSFRMRTCITIADEVIEWFWFIRLCFLPPRFQLRVRLFQPSWVLFFLFFEKALW